MFFNRASMRLNGISGGKNMALIAQSTVLPAPPEDVWDIIRDFNGHETWHPAVASSLIERGYLSDMVGCVRQFRLQDGAELREQLLALSDADHSFTYCLLETPVPLFNYIAHVRLLPVTDGNATFWEWQAQFDAPECQLDQMRALVGNQIIQAGFQAIHTLLGADGPSSTPQHHVAQVHE